MHSYVSVWKTIIGKIRDKKITCCVISTNQKQILWHLFIVYFNYFLLKFVLFYWSFPSGSAVKNLPAMQEPQKMWIQSLGREDPREEGMATHSSNFAWRIFWTMKPGGLQSWLQISHMTEAT